MADDDLTEDGLENSIKGTGKEAIGKAEDAAGGLTGDSKLQAEGKMDQLKGKVQNAFGKMERAIDETLHHKKEPPDDEL